MRPDVVARLPQPFCAAETALRMILQTKMALDFVMGVAVQVASAESLALAGICS